MNNIEFERALDTLMILKEKNKREAQWFMIGSYYRRVQLNEMKKLSERDEE